MALEGYGPLTVTGRNRGLQGAAEALGACVNRRATRPVAQRAG